MESRHKRFKTEHGAITPPAVSDFPMAVQSTSVILSMLPPTFAPVAQIDNNEDLELQAHFKEPGIFLFSQDHIDKSAANINPLQGKPRAFANR